MNISLLMTIMLGGLNEAPAPTSPVAVGTLDIADGAIGTVYNISTAGLFSGHPMMGYSLNGTLPAGLNLNTSNGVISGATTTQATYSAYSVTATNSLGSDTTNTDSMTVLPPESSGSGIGELFNLTELFNTVELHA